MTKMIGFKHPIFEGRKKEERKQKCSGNNILHVKQ